MTKFWEVKTIRGIPDTLSHNDECHRPTISKDCEWENRSEKGSAGIRVTLSTSHEDRYDCRSDKSTNTNAVPSDKDPGCTYGCGWKDRTDDESVPITALEDPCTCAQSDLMDAGGVSKGADARNLFYKVWDSVDDDNDRKTMLYGLIIIDITLS
ncbi:uncharacterized protein F5147DRAFT_652167 [Suillus discolor]|uniref:Uncharacterized protein n=1 Tax=Suillus discolor TaxID=1912936 RepID=A0A9P7F9R4_9AGAM|nr:uncharacterized protein F5147DRAFT_652167 [Suillus discolor]KAG2109997.1 hypothetical protein F5147DRAFT_652167 [Suillus discolor]